METRPWTETKYQRSKNQKSVTRCPFETLRPVCLWTGGGSGTWFMLCVNKHNRFWCFCLQIKPEGQNLGVLRLTKSLSSQKCGNYIFQVVVFAYQAANTKGVRATDES